MKKNRYYYMKMTTKILVKVSLLFCMNNALFLVLSCLVLFRFAK